VKETNERKVKSGPSDDFIREWEEVMGGEFAPEDVQIFILEAKSEEVSQSFRINKKIILI
jgi:hypothetical protein